MSRLYDFRGLERFKSRFRPRSGRYNIIIRLSRPIGLRAMLHLQVFIPGGMLRFLAETCRRLLRRVQQTGLVAVRFQVSLLVPWTILLACIDGERWFGDQSSSSGLALLLDLGMVIALGTLARLIWQRRAVVRRMSMFLSGATLTDFILSLVQAVTLHDNVDGWAGLFVTMGVAGPAFATLFLMALAVALAARGLP